MTKFKQISEVMQNIKNIGGTVLKDNETYVVQDNTTLKNLVLSSTNLHAGKCTTGHKHADQEEIYFFVSGTGEMELSKTDQEGDTTKFPVKAGDIIQIEDGAFHKVYNTSTKEDLYFVCVFDGKRTH